MTAKRIIVNADDYGLCEEISTGILAAADKGIVSATSVVTIGRHYKKGRQALLASNLDTGIHLTLVGGETPMTGPIEGLTDGRGKFLQDYRRTIPRIILGRYDARGLQRELMAQTARLAEDGFEISHMDAHQHLHVLPPIAAMVVKVAQRFNISWVRRPRAHALNLKGLGINFFSWLAASQFKQAGLRTTEHFEGFDVSGGLDQGALDAILERIRPGVTELMTHPGYHGATYQAWNFGWADERRALTSAATRRRMRTEKILLTDFRGIQ